jgi:phosphoribosylformylglycinamidine synthase
MLEAEDRVVVRYLDNPNGALRDIAGICSAGRNVMGMMPHPERASDDLLGCSEGRVILASMVQSLMAAHA